MLGELLGRGGMAEVFSGYVIGSHGFQKPVAIKRLLPELANDHVFVERLIGEAKLLVGMQHGNIVSVLDLARDGDDVFLVMEYVDGPSLRQLIKARGTRRLSLGTSTYIVQAAAQGLEFAHARPGGAVIHADISPSNLLLTTSGEVRVADFGIARREGGGAGVVEGKWAYMAPEQARGEALTPRSDVFALGVVLYELITGQHPLGQKITSDERDSGPIRIVPPRVMDPSIPPGLDAICMKALSENARDRYARMQQLIDALIDERFTNQWRDGANDLAQVIREIGAGNSPNAGPRTQVTDRPVTIMTRSLISQPARASAPQVAASSDDSIDTFEHTPSRPSRPSRPSTLPATAETLDGDVPTPAPRASAMLIPNSGARTSVIQMPVIPVPSGPLPLPPTLRMDGTPQQPYRLSSAMLPSPELASVHGGATVTGAAAIDVRAATTKWTFAVFGVAALIGVIAAIAITSTAEAPAADEAAVAEEPTPVEQAAAQPAQPEPTVPEVAPAPAPQPTVPETAVVPAPATAPVETAPVEADKIEVEPAIESRPEPKRKSRGEKSKKQTASLVADSTLRVNTVNASDEPVWAWVIVNGQRVYAPAKLKLPAGRYTVRVTNPDYPVRNCSVTMDSGRVVTLKVDLEEDGCNE